MFKNQHLGHPSVRRKKVVQSVIGKIVIGGEVMHCVVIYRFALEYAAGLETGVTVGRFTFGKWIIVFG